MSDVLHRITGPAPIHADFSQHLKIAAAFDPPVSIHLEGSAELRDSIGVRLFRTSDPEDGPLLAHRLDRRLLRELVIYRDGQLVLSLDGGESLTVRPDHLYEAWQVWQDGSPWIGLPGGGVG